MTGERMSKAALLQDRKKKPSRYETILNSITYLVSTLFYYHIFSSLHLRSFLSKSETHRGMEILCADCGCLPSECKSGPSPRECLNCGRNVVVAGGSCPTTI